MDGESSDYCDSTITKVNLMTITNAAVPQLCHKLFPGDFNSQEC